MKKMPVLKPGDSVEIIAPASRCSDESLLNLKELLQSWDLRCIVDPAIFGQDILCANSDALRFNFLKKALEREETKAVFCARGGYGSMRLIPELHKIRPPVLPKLFVGMSDITALLLYFENQWQWPVLHGALSRDKFSPDSTACLKSFLFNETASVVFDGIALNHWAKTENTLQASVTGGNLSLVQTSIGSIWQINGQNKIIFLEEIGERGYRVDRMLEHMRQAGIFKEAVAVVFGDFTEGKEPDGASKIESVLERFACESTIPVLQIKGIGHGYINFPMPLGTEVQLELGARIRLSCFR